MVKVFIAAIVKFLVNLGMAATAERFISSCFFGALGALAELTDTQKDDARVKLLEEAYRAYMESK